MNSLSLSRSAFKNHLYSKNHTLGKPEFSPDTGTTVNYLAIFIQRKWAAYLAAKMERTLSYNTVFWDYFLVIFQIMMAYKLKILYPVANGRLVFTIAIVYTVQKKQTNQKGRTQSLKRSVTEVVLRNI